MRILPAIALTVCHGPDGRRADRHCRSRYPSKTSAKKLVKKT